MSISDGEIDKRSKTQSVIAELEITQPGNEEASNALRICELPLAGLYTANIQM
jgi:hypothetical protein